MSDPSTLTPPTFGEKRGFFSRLTGRRPRKAAPRVPDGVRIYAVGDIHGCADQLDRLFAAIEADAKSWPGPKYLIFLGDYCDRGPDSKGVIDRLLTIGDGFTRHHLRGNHDQVILDFLADPTVYRSWREFGAPETLMSYGVMPPRFDDDAAYIVARDRFAAALPASHLRFLQNLQYSAKIGDYFFVHAGVKPGTDLDRQVPEDLLWIRDEFLMSKGDFGAVVVHGHTPGEKPVRRSNRIGIDTGVYATGKLAAAVLEAESCKFIVTSDS
jgi:serine/threonine protein phosphatase 1